MKPLDRNLSILEHIVSYCEQIEQTVERFGNDYAIFGADPIYRNAAALCILQIGELVGKLSDDFRAAHPAVPWRQIKAMRNIVAHSYGSVDPETTWEIITEDIPTLKNYCCMILWKAHFTRIVGWVTFLRERTYKFALDYVKSCQTLCCVSGSFFD